MATALAAWWPTLQAFMSSSARLKEVKVNNILPNGHYKDGVTWSASVASVAGAQPAGTVPSFVCIAYSWTTAKARGSAHGGRNYLPNSWGTIGGGSVVTGGTQTQLLASAKGFLDCFKNAVMPVNGPIHPAIVSPGGIKIGPGMNRITGVRVGRVIDVQRRRKGAIPESYAASSWS